MSKKKNKMSKFGRTEIDESLKSMGDIAKLTLLRLRVAIYIRGNSGDIKKSMIPDTNMKKRIANIENFIRCKTNWQPIALYTDIDDITYYRYDKDCFYKPDFKNQLSLNALLESINNRTININVLVVDSISQISRDLESIQEVFDNLILNQVIIFCLDTRNVIAMNSLVHQRLAESSFELSGHEHKHI